MADRLPVARQAREMTITGEPDLAALVLRNEPVILRGYAANWPLVRAGLESARTAADYVLRFDRGRPVTGYVGEAAIEGRFHYDATATGLNFQAVTVPLCDFMAQVLDGAEGSPALYMGSTDLDAYLPGLRDENALVPSDGLFARHPPMASIWIGNRTIASAHYDMANNAAICAVGRRRFTLFPPDQIGNLYPGPLAPTPGGQVVSMVDFARPDLTRYPRFAEAIDHAVVAELEPGDMLVYPALWWHHVEALEAFNILVNYWWNAAPDYLDTPMDTVLHAMLSLRDRPDAEKQAWRAIFDHYIFGQPEAVIGHLPPASHGPLAPLDGATARRLRAYLLQRLNR
ncbi:cupin-like domain-containing protein [Sphingomonas sp. CFBP8993]|uniref:cupin-like domain-containing protein n=1 Tax=Sphingomonas sp. CFBP8993 TaxID=3096526 RepID=UPI002A6B255B|nr:cupin-like domain-containing protein [Sphingomonas sp. CFBP8993]MDY0957604.1 cupin-like domain-containing protein [Sphingomonas sp. CFBP8993]